MIRFLSVDLGEPPDFTTVSIIEAIGTPSASG